jgi:hypothetical protein
VDLRQDYVQARVLEVALQFYASGQLIETALGLLARQGVAAS